MSFERTDVPENIDITTLVSGARWTGVKVAIDTRASKIPLGVLSIAGEVRQGNDALRGFDWRLKKEGTELSRTTEYPSFRVLGYAPSTILENGVDLDNRSTGAGSPVGHADRLFSRAVTTPKSPANVRLVTAIRPVTFGVRAGDEVEAETEARTITRTFRFWFKDVLFVDDDAVPSEASAATDFDVWNDVDKLVRSGFEWRIAPTETLEADATMRSGRSELPFFGFRCEPLRLLGLKLAGDAVGSARILCRLRLADEDLAPGDNLITLTIARVGESEVYEAKFSAEPLKFAITAEDASSFETKRRRRMVIDAVLGAGNVFAVKPTDVSVEVCGLPVHLKTTEDSPKLTISTDTDEATGTRSDLVTLTAKDTGSERASSGSAVLTVTDVRLTTGLEIASTAGKASIRAIPPSVHADWALEIVPKGHADGLLDIAPTMGTPPEARPLLKVVSATSEGGSTPTRDVTLFEMPIGGEADIVEGPETLALSLRNGALEVGNAEFVVTVGLALRLTADEPGRARAVSGHCEGQMLQRPQGTSATLTPGIDLVDGRLGFVCSTGRGSTWEGTVTVSGRLTAANAIRWPSVVPASTQPIPLPEIGRAHV
jgi:hypothetical protein